MAYFDSSSQRRLSLTRFFAIMIVLLSLGTTFTASAADQPAAIVKDINTSSGASVAVAPTQMVAFGSNAYFVAAEASVGAELWRSDGSAAGTVLVADIYPGIGGANPTALTVVGTTLFFSANNGDSGSELWKVDGAGNVALVADLVVGAGSSSPSELTNVAGTLFFVASDGVGGTGLWKSGGTAATTVKVTGLAVNAAPAELIALGNTLFFAATDATGTELWQSDGTAASRVYDIAPGPDSSRPTNLVAAGATLFFTADDNVHGRELWRSNGIAGTSMVKDIRPGKESGAAKELTAVGAMLFFSATDDATGTELWKSDGTDGGTKLVRDIYPGGEPGETPQAPISPFGSSPKYLTAVGNLVYFRAQNASTGYELWRSDGSSETTVLVRDINPGSDGSSLLNLTNVNGTLFFRADDNANGRELWKVDGAGAAQQVKDINPGRPSADPSLFTNVNGTLFFVANDGSGPALWKSSGSSTTRIRAIVSGGSALPSDLTAVNGKLFFSADDNATGRELWVSDGTLAGTKQVKDIRRSGSSLPQQFTNVAGTLFFIADSGSGPGLWRSDGTAAGTVLVDDDFASGTEIAPPDNLVDVDGVLYFTAVNSQFGHEVWRSDGTLAGTVPLKDIVPGEDGSDPSNLIDVNGSLYFVARTDSFGYELWKSDGTASGTTAIDINPGSANSFPANLTAVNGQLYFTADDARGRELWKANNGGATIARDIVVGPGSAQPSDLTASNESLYFTAQDAAGRELWKSGGTPATTMRVKDIVAGPGSSSPEALTAANGQLFFRANDGVSGSELWVSDGTDAGTTQVRDILPGPSGAVPQAISQIRASGRVLFNAYTPATGSELWLSDGTTAGTTQVQELAPGSASSNPARFTLAGATPAEARIFFAAQQPGTGVELWSLLSSSLNTAPTLADATQAVHINRPFSGMLAARDAERDALTYTLLTASSHGTLTLTNPATGAFTYTPAPGFLGADSFTYSVSDGLAAATSTVSLDVTNTPPTATGASLTTHANRALAATLTGADVDSDPLTFRIATNPTQGSLVLTNPLTGAFSYTPTANTLGTASFSFVANDGYIDSPPATVTISVTNNPPVAQDLDETPSFDTPFNATLIATDADGDLLDFVIVANGSKGLATITNPATGAFRYQPNPGARGVDIITFKANDGLADSNLALLTIAFGNAAPLAYNMSLTVPINGQIHGLLRASDADPEDQLTFALTSPSANGVVQVDAATGAFSYTPNRNYKGVDTFRFTATDGKTRSSAATVTITVQRPTIYLPMTQR